MKALLAERGIDFPRTHDLARLIELAEEAGYELPASIVDIDALTPFAVSRRYDSSETNLPLNRLKVRELVHHLRRWVEEQLNEGNS